MIIKVTQKILIALAFVISIIGNLTIDSSTIFKNERRTAFSFPQNCKIFMILKPYMTLIGMSCKKP